MIEECKPRSALRAPILAREAIEGYQLCLANVFSTLASAVQPAADCAACVWRRATGVRPEMGR